MVAVARERDRRQRQAEGAPTGPAPARRLQVVDEEWLRRRAGEVGLSRSPSIGQARRRHPSAAVLHRRRVVAVALVAVLAIGAAFGFRALGEHAAPQGAVAAGAHVTQRVWIVRPGDTVWSLVEASGVRGDIRPVVDRIEARLHDRALQVGQRVVVPVPR